MMSAQCYIPRFNDMGHLIQNNKILKVFTLIGNGGQPHCSEQILVLLTLGGSTCNLVSVSPIALK